MISRLNPKHVVAEQHEASGAWLIGFLFSERDSGESAMAAVAELYNAAAAVVERRPDTDEMVAKR